MYYKELGKIETDEHTGKKYGKDQQIELLGHIERDNKIIRVVKCKECAKDPELHGEGLFETTLSRLTEGRIPCCCNKNNYTERHITTLIKRKCKELSFEFEGFVGDYVGKQTLLKLKCLKHDYSWCTTSVSRLLNSLKGCKMCQYDNNSTNSKIPDDIMTEELTSTGYFPDGTYIKRKESSKGSKQRVLLHCPICSVDKYVQAGLCSGIFESDFQELKLGHKPCRCGIQILTEPQMEFNIKSIIEEKEQPHYFVRWLDSYKNKDSKFIRYCNEHGEFETSVHNFLQHKHACPSCAQRSQNIGYIHNIKENDNIIAIKFGITSKLNRRTRDQRNRTKLIIETESAWLFPTVKQCQECEKFIKRNFKCKFLTKEQLPDGYTETCNPLFYNDIVKIFKQYGAVEMERILD